MRSKFLWINSLLIILCFLVTTDALAQFTYGGLRLSYHNVRFDKGGDFEGTRINDFAANIDLLHRPLRNVGIGINARIPIVHGFKYQYIIGDYGDQIVGGGSAGDRKVEFAGGNFEYNIQNTFSLTLLGRLFFDTENNYFLDIRYTFETYEETFSFLRRSGSLPSESIKHMEKITATGVGFSVGVQPMISDHFYFTYVFTVDFLGYDGVSFDYDIQTGNSGSDNYVTIRSKIDDTQTAYEFSTGIGYLF